MPELLVGTKKGCSSSAVSAPGTGRRGAGVRGRRRRVRDARPSDRSLLRERDERLLRTPCDVDRRRLGEWEAAKGPAFPEGTDIGRSDLGHHARGGRRGPVRGGRSGGTVHEHRRRSVLEPERTVVEGADRGRLATGVRRARLALDLSVARRAGTSRGRGVRGRRVAHGRRRRHVVHRLHRPRSPLPAGGGSRGTNALCVHNMHRAPTAPERLFMQFHGSVYRSDDAGYSWNEIAEGLPSGFGFPLAIDPADPDSAFVIPLTADDRVTPDGKVRVFETRDAGASWTARGDGLPGGDAWLTVLRQALGATARARSSVSGSGLRAARCSEAPTPAGPGRPWPPVWHR